MTTVIIVCGPPPEGPWSDSCVSCGGYTKAEGGPFTAPPGSVLVGAVYCSEECWEEWEEVLVREAGARRRQTALCPVCGFDRQEHEEGCEMAEPDPRAVAALYVMACPWIWVHGRP